MKRYRIKVSAESIQRMRNTNILVGWSTGKRPLRRLKHKGKIILQRIDFGFGYISAGPRQHSHSWFLVPRKSRPYFSVSRLWKSHNYYQELIAYFLFTQNSISFPATRTAYKTPCQKVLLLLHVYSLPQECVYWAIPSNDRLFWLHYFGLLGGNTQKDIPISLHLFFSK
jgi:hypothetical protein